VVVTLELVACVAAAAALWMISGRIQGALAEVQTVFLTVAMAFGLAFVRFVAKLIMVLVFRCPRCDGRFHLNASRVALSVRSCAHCRTSVDPSTPDPAEAPNR
jgi:hypothetical protein